MSKIIAPPTLVPGKYTSWRKEMALWEIACNIDANKQAPTVCLNLPSKAKEAILEMEPAELNKADGMKKLYDKLDGLYKEDANQAALASYETFEKYSRPSEMTIADYLIEFDRMNAQLSVHNIKLPEPVLAYRALKSANLTNDNEKLVKATVTELTLKAMSAQLKKVMGTGTVNEASGIQIKKEEVAFTEDIQSKQENEEVLYSGWSRGRSRVREFRGRTPFRGRRGRSGRPSYRTPGRGRWPRTSQTDKLNPIGPDGNISTCYNCKSKYHWANDCEIDDDNEEEALIVLLCEEDFVYTAQDEKEKITKTLLGETLGCMVLDSGTTSTVAGLTWFNCFTDTLSERMKKE